MISIAKSAADPVGRYSRPDVMHLLLNTTPNPVVEYFQQSIQELNLDAQPIEGIADEANIKSADTKNQN